jgi:dolichyl-phosphate-mannose--protein O-mannosyl transferase
MMWQMWTAFGIMLGYVSDLAFYKVSHTRHITGLNWRLMLASVMICIFFTYTPSLKSQKGWYTRTLPNGTSLFLPRITALAHVKGSVR